MNLCYSHIERQTMTKWTENFFRDLIHAYQPNLTSYYLGLSFSSQARHKKDKQSAFKREMTAKSADFMKLDPTRCYAHFLRAKRSVACFEMEALPHQRYTNDSIPTPEVIETIHSLVTDPRNTVVIIGNHTKKSMDHWFLVNRKLGVASSNLWIAAESGYLYKAGNDHKWSTLTMQNPDFAWKAQVRKILQGYTENINGSYIEERQSCILWNYKNAEPEHVTMFIHDLYNGI